MLTNIKIGNGALGNAEFMDNDSFRLRVEKVFGSLASSSSSSLQSPLCSVTDNEVERKEWKRSLETAGRDETPCSTLSFDEYLEEEYPGLSRRSNFGNDDELDGQDDRDRWSIGSSIGLDPTLDYEEEEEEDEYEYDKVACGRENAGDHLYTGDVSEDGSFLNSHNVLPNSLHAPVKDPRANLLSAQVRLKEDETEAPKSNSVLASAAEIKEPQIKASQDDTYPKSILKKRSNEASSKTQKRVRFSLGCKTDSGGAPNALCYGSQGGSGVPDFLVNPSKFSRYNSDSSEDEDDTIEQQACGNFVSQAKSFDGKSVAEWENGSADLPKSYTFVSKKKSSDSKAVNDGNEVKQNKEVDSMQSVFPVGITAGEVDDQTETNTGDGFPEPCRGYQTMLRSDSSDSSGGSDS